MVAFGAVDWGYPKMRRIVVLALSIVILALPATAEAAPPVNDDFADALAFAEPLPALAAVSTAESTTETGEPVPSCIDNGEFGASVWYTYTPSVKTSVALDTQGSNFDTVVAFYTGAALNALTEIGCNDEVSFSPSTANSSRVAKVLAAGTTYRIQISGRLGATGSLVVRLAKRRTTPAVARGTAWHLNSNFDGDADYSFTFGSAAHYPLVGTTLAKSGGFGENGVSTPTALEGNDWFMNDWFDSGVHLVLPFGRAVDFPVVGDINGDGADDIGVVQGNVWHFDTGLDGLADVSFAYGRYADFPIMGDWDGNGTFTPGVVRGNTWILNNGFDPIGDLIFPFGTF
ncbi:MAG: hypothetical protein ACRDKS_09560, partial [Actinomycetota bacterium]